MTNSSRSARLLISILNSGSKELPVETCNTDSGLKPASPSAVPGVLKRIRLELARSEKFPVGSFRHGYEFIAPLDAGRHIDIRQWKKLRDHCPVRRFWADEDQIGRLVHRPG